MATNNDFVTPTREAVSRVMNGFTTNKFVELKDSPLGTTNFYLKANVIIIIGIIGPFRGRIMFSFNNNTADELAMSMMKLDSIKGIEKELIYSTCQEFTNMVSGAIICNDLLDSGLDITPPTMIFSKKMFISSMGTPIHLVPFELNGKRLNILISVK